MDTNWFHLLEHVSEEVDQTISPSGRHSMRVAHLSISIADELGLSEHEKTCLWWGAVLHDVGKILLPRKMLQKNGPLDQKEWQIMEMHPDLGSRLVELRYPDGLVAKIVRAHQERYDGAGYPDGLAGEQIPLAARVLAVVDAYDAMTNDRHYRQACAHRSALDEIQSLRGRQFDPRVVDIFMRLFDYETGPVQL